MVSYGLDKRVTRTRKNTHPTASNKIRMVRTPGHRLVVHYVKKTLRGARTPKWHGNKRLNGIRAYRASDAKKVPHMKRSVSRPYGGVLSHDLVREKIVRAFLVEEQKIVKRVLKLKKQEGEKETKPTTKKEKNAPSKEKSAPSKEKKVKKEKKQKQ